MFAVLNYLSVDEKRFLIDDDEHSWNGGTLEKDGQRFSIPTTRAIVDAIEYSDT